jgi:sugar lactone lactonase YvrE
MALDTDHNWLYLADTGSHLIRRVDFAARRVETVAGNGELGDVRRGSGPAREMPLNSPWDVCLLGGNLFIAMAGLHQVWRYDPVRETVGVYAGSGSEGRRDGPADEAALAQPSGLATDGARLFVADSENSAIRVVTPGAGGEQAVVRTLAGGDLFLFGDRDGRGDLARFQHPLGVAWASDGAAGMLYVADAYNHKLRGVSAHDGVVVTLADDGAAGMCDGELAEARFFEPGGLAYAGGRLYVADTNNHAIRVVDLAAGTVRTLVLAGLCAPGLCLPG